MEQEYSKLSKNHQKLYINILEYDDVVLLDWLHDRTEVPAEFQELVSLIQSHMRS